MLSFREIALQEKLEYEVYHNSYSSVATEIEKFAEKRGYTLDDTSDSEKKGEQMFNVVGTGPSKPKPGKTNKLTFELYKGSKLQKKFLQASVYNRETKSNEYELTMYIN
jgi:hypothetical protein